MSRNVCAEGHKAAIVVATATVIVDIVIVVVDIAVVNRQGPRAESRSRAFSEKERW